MFFRLKIVAAACLVAIFCGVWWGCRPAATVAEWRPGKEFMAYLRADAYPDAPREEFSKLEGAAGQVNEVRIPAQRPAAPASAENDAQYAQALEMLRAGNLTAAEKALAEFLKKHTEHSDGWRQLGDCYYNLGKIDAAVGAYRTALRLKSDNYLAKRGHGVAALYLGYEFYEQDSIKLAHRYFQQALQSLHECLESNANDQLAAYGQALAAEGVSRELYRIAQKALNSDNEETAKNIIRNCLDILDVAVTATEDRLSHRPEDNDARMLLGGLFLRRARMLQPFGHIEEASDNLMAAVRAYEPVIKSGGTHADSAKAQTAVCGALIKEWNHSN